MAKIFNRHIVLRQLSAGLMLVLFAFCITPKKTLHDLIANHKDSPYALGGTTQQIENAGFRCNCDNLVVESPFVVDFVPVEINIAATHTSYIVAADYDLSFFSHFYFELRGPPCFA